MVDSADDARKAVRERYKAGADLIKVMATGGGDEPGARPAQGPQMTQEELDVIVATARDYGMSVAAHAHGAAGIERAVRAGVATIEHGTYMDEALIRLMKERGTYLVPTLMAGEWITEKAKIDGHLPEIVRPKAAAIGPLMAANFARAHRAGVKILSRHRQRRFRAWPQRARVRADGRGGHAPMDAIRAATSVPAAYLGIADRYGSIEPGKVADLIAVPGDPIADIGVLTRGELRDAGRHDREGRQVSGERLHRTDRPVPALPRWASGRSSARPGW